ncbi:efflux RND transporter periplasmic adaptor subunit [Rhodopirellula halodulae]|uniref:efflux RND transporter periplasmic adaptor subunit n=1 Tax=Rhodopirellula halodulae TaxID=2894198 RepID=UPI001E498565|nr:efflux RND transporter periplasmic adaptor subunit [Rhodopirellula sp. JC737]MCC9655020.1 efflux RND transporter periplasmic adaptor subunit [Rhodopirellula sp. JC737]
MSQQGISRAGLRALIAAGVLTLVFGLGTAAGLVLSPSTVHAPEDLHSDDPHPAGMSDLHIEDEDTEEDHLEENHEEDHVALTEQAYANLGLRMGMVQRGDHWKTQLVPARVVEIPGRSDLSVSAPVTGIVQKVEVLPGQSLVSDSTLFSIRITDQAVIDAQSRLLETLTRQEVANQEITRLSPLVTSGAVSRNKLRDLEYEIKQLSAQQSTLVQELRSRGLPSASVDQVLQNRELATELKVSPPSFIDSDMNSEEVSGFSVEDLMVHPGMSVARGDLLCSVAYHSRLYLEGMAFQDDLHVLDRIMQRDWMVVVDDHSAEHAHGASVELPLLRIDNHVDEATQSVTFFVELPNEVTRDRVSDGRLFQQWRFRPGQRLHLRLPVEQWKDQWMLPAEAVVVEGPDAFVFVEHIHDEEDEPEHDDHDVMIELEPVPIRLLYRDDRIVVIQRDDQQDLEEEFTTHRVALNNAQKLYLAMKMQAEGGGGHHHHHDH